MRCLGDGLDDRLVYFLLIRCPSLGNSLLLQISVGPLASVVYLLALSKELLLGALSLLLLLDLEVGLVELVQT